MVAKFMPGVSLVTPPLAGALGLELRLFLFFDSIGALLWAASAVGLGYVFSEQIDLLLADLAVAGRVALEAALGVFAIFLIGKWWRRRRLLAPRGIETITVAQLHRMQANGRAPVVIDVRSKSSRLMEPWIVSGALLGGIEHMEQTTMGISPGREIVTYCNCPNEATAARAARTLIAMGYRHVRPLKGGLAAWIAAGHSVRHLPSAAAASEAGGSRRLAGQA
jgi:rhodanese-related sulfurtransferase